MNGSEPPRVATWLLRHFGSSPSNDSVIGDLNERYEHGRSRSWYWWQVFVAIAESLLTDIHLNKLLVLRALVVGVAFKVVSSHSIALIIGLWSRYQRPWNNPNVPVFGVAATLVLCGYTGRLLALLSRRHAKPIVFSFLLLQFVTVIPFIGNALAPISWTAEFGGRLYALLWNTPGMTALAEVCDACTTRVWSSPLLFWEGALLTAVTLLLGSGVLVDDSLSNSEERPESATT